MTAVLSPQALAPIMQSEGNDTASPHPRTRRQNNKQNRQNQQNHEVFSDSNLPSSGTPKSRKTPRNNQHADRSASAAIPQRNLNSAQNQKGRPASMAVANGNLATPSKASYAGAAFNASPAPSSLPVPKFFSKSVPQSNASSGLQARVEREGDRSDSNDGGPRSSLSPSVPRSQVKSPLDMFFDADRQEKARTGSAGANQPSHSSSQSRSETPSKPRDMFMLELDGTSSPAGSQTATPPSIRPSSSSRPHSSIERSRTAPENVPTLQQQSEESRRAQQTQSLKSFLNLTASELPSQSPFLSTPQNSGFATPSHTPQQDPNLLYGNRNLSPMFQAARSPPAQPSPHHQGFQPISPQQNFSNYSNVYGSPSRPPQGPPFQNQNMYQPQFHGPPQGPPQGIGLPNHQGNMPNGTSPVPGQHQTGPNDDVRAMEEKMRRMLKMG